MGIKDILKKRILVLDGAMGTMIQRYALSEADYRGERFAGCSVNQKGNNDILVLTKPDIIKEIHYMYLDAGADIIETDTFNATTISMEDYDMVDYVYEINFEAAKIAKEAADEYTKRDTSKPRFVAGSIGPTNKTTSISPDVNEPAFRAITFDQLKDSYYTQAKALIEGGVDILLIETIFDTLNAKAAIAAIESAVAESEREIPLMLSLTLSDVGGRTLSGQTLEAFLASVSHADILSIGLNCSFGAKDIKPFLKQLANIAPYNISCHSNAGLPNRFGEYDETPETMAIQVKEFIDEGLVNIIGGCCGTTPDHIAAYKELLENSTPHMVVDKEQKCSLSGLEPLHIVRENNFINVGERCNVAGSKKFLRLIKEKNYDEAMSIARLQVEDGAQIVDINMDDAMLDAKEEMTHFLNLIAGEPDICRVPVMIDSSKFDVIESALKCVQGKSIVNSISLKEGEDIFLERAKIVKGLGAALIVMAFDEKGQADTYERRIEICSRAYRLLVDKIGFNPYDIIFDPNVLAVATGIKEHNNYCVDFINTTKWIKNNLPGAKVSGGVSNLSFSFRGNNYIRECMHAVFLYHAINEGMDMGIVNPATAVTYSEIPSDLLTVIEDVILNRSDEATERLIDAAEALKGLSVEKADKKDPREEMSVAQKLEYALLKGNPDYMDEDISAALKIYDRAVDIIDGPLMSGMNKVGELFGEGKMFLPQVVKSARTMKRAVELLKPSIEAQKNDDDKSASAGKFLLATVKGDVHDIGKNIVGVILACNNFDVIDLGVMVSTEDIIKTAIEEKVDFIGLSGLITPSLEEMCIVAEAMQKAGMTIPLMIGGATTSKLHTAVKIAPKYDGPVFHLKDAAQNPVIATQLKNNDTRDVIIESLNVEQQALRDSIKKEVTLTPYAEAKSASFKIDWSKYDVPVPIMDGIIHIDNISISDLKRYINWKYFFSMWKIGGEFSKIADIHGCDSCKATWIASFPVEARAKASEAMQLFKDANRMLEKLQNMDAKLVARCGILKAASANDIISVHSQQHTFNIPCLRQQYRNNSKADYYLSLADYIAPQEEKEDYLGAFVVSIGRDFMYLLDKYKAEGDDYNSLLLQSLGDRLVEAASEWLHEKVRKEIWGYSKDEQLSDKDIVSMRYRGIRPAVGYPSLPDQSLNFILNDILDFGKIDVSITENGAMYPNATVSGLYFANPQASYFLIGDIDDSQKHDYAKRRGFSDSELRKFIR